MEKIPQHSPMPATPESDRIAARDSGTADWGLWGPYLSDREWGTVREDYYAAGLLIAFYQLGYGLAAFGVGPLENLLKLPLPQIFAAAAAPALALALLATLLGRREPGKNPRP
jgi:hypothetical protein